MGLEFELRALNLQNRCSPVHFGLVILEMKSLKLFVLADLKP
jgi:hypothetical protein